MNPQGECCGECWSRDAIRRDLDGAATDDVIDLVTARRERIVAADKSTG